MKTWEDVRAWRRATRAELLARRLRVSRGEKERVRAAVREFIWQQFTEELQRACIGFYWPFKGEIDLRHLVRDFLAAGAQAALPTIVERGQPLEFWAWRPRMKLKRGIWDIPVPAVPNAVRPTALLVPLLGFDAAGYRLGYGGGYYDRTLATMNPAPLTIGVGYELGRLETIHPQPHDIPLDAIVTEAGCARFRYRGEPIDRRTADETTTYASPPCFMHELDPTYLE
jgi:5-formyltetrahydrofolate cyclo-ligase